MAQNGITDVVEVGDLGLIKDQAVLELARVAKDDAIAHHDVLADVSTVADLASLADPGGSLDHRTMLDDGASPDENGSADEGLADELAENPRLETELEVRRDLGKRLPGMSHVLKNDTVLGAVEVEEIVGGEHTLERMNDE